LERIDDEDFYDMGNRLECKEQRILQATVFGRIYMCKCRDDGRKNVWIVKNFCGIGRGGDVGKEA
jgi:hypothetical protein